MKFVLITTFLISTTLLLNSCYRQFQPQLELVSKENIDLGEFTLTSEKIVVADPGYSMSSIRIPGLGAIIRDCVPGQWKAVSVIKKFRSRSPKPFSVSSELMIYHNTNKEGSVFPFGVVTNAGYGDGGYEYSIARNEEGKVIGLHLFFIDDEGKG